MVIFKQVATLQNYLQKLKIAGASLGFVPTMGALHEGHLSLVEKSKQAADKTICSIFVNPAQFNNPEDFEKYPVTIEQDVNLLEKSGCDILFLPGLPEIYPDTQSRKESFDLGYLENILEGKYRPGHFQGVCLVVKRLLGIVNPDYLFAGQKDYQQCLVLQRLLQLINSTIQFIICATEREKDGLAMSSRNLRLNKEERLRAPGIYHTLLFLQQNIKKGNLKRLKELAVERLREKDFKVDYAEVANAGNLQIIEDWNGTESIVILVAANINNVRLIDNLKYAPEC